VRLSRALVIGVFSLLVILFVGLLFWPFILNEIITPTSLAAWVLLRIFVLSLDQKYYWMAIIFHYFYFSIPSSPAPVSPHYSIRGFPAFECNHENLDYWHSLFNLIDQRAQDDEMLKKGLARLLLSLYATKQHTAADFSFV